MFLVISFTFLIISIVFSNFIIEKDNLTIETKAQKFSVKVEEFVAEETATETIATEKLVDEEKNTELLEAETVNIVTVEPEESVEEETTEVEKWTGQVLNQVNGRIEGPSGTETYYNLDMSGVIQIMKQEGYCYEYSVRDDGVKMYGEYVMVAANLNLRPRGTIVETSLGKGIVCDTGSFAHDNPTQLDIAVNW